MGGEVGCGRVFWFRARREGGGVRFKRGRSGCAGFLRSEEESVKIEHNWGDQLVRREKVAGRGVAGSMVGVSSFMIW